MTNQMKELYFNSNNTTIGTISNCSVSTESITDMLKDKVEEIIRKPEVRVDQRSTIEVNEHKVKARYYKDGFFTGSKDLIPAIKSIEVFENKTKTIKMTFVNGDIQTATVQSGDPYFFEDGLMRCIVKEMIGKEGTAVLSKLLSYATNFYDKAEADKKKKAKEEADKKAAAEKNYKKLQKHWEKKRAKERENRIQEMAEAIVRAEEMKKNV